MATGNGTRRRRCPAGCGKLLSPRGLQRHLDAAHPDWETGAEAPGTITVSITVNGETVFAVEVDAETAKTTAQELIGAQLDESLPVS